MRKVGGGKRRIRGGRRRGGRRREGRGREGRWRERGRRRRGDGLLEEDDQTVEGKEEGFHGKVGHEDFIFVDLVVCIVDVGNEVELVKEDVDDSGGTITKRKGHY